ncbi:MAG: AAA family ATPase [Dysgonamonadaceae bacterium]|nr:AAA family ATPase [Dysgonamonadaceae bacterium]
MVFLDQNKTNNEEPNDFSKVNVLDSFANWFSIPTERHNYMNDDFSNSISKLKEILLEYERVYESEFGSKVFTFNKNNKDAFIAQLESNLYKKKGEFFELSKKASNHLPRAVLGKNNYLAFLKKEYSVDTIIPPKKLKPQTVDIRQAEFNLSDFKSACDKAGLIYSNQLLTRFVASLATKPFVLLTGLSGSGKTKLAQAFAQWICESKEQYCIVPVGADWINREPLLGYVNALDNREYVLPENEALELIIRANEDRKKPYFLVLDEMNLSHVERYFADFLSVMESKDKIKLHSAEENLNSNANNDFLDAVEVPSKISWPENLFVIGTVNIDETTYMFSPKVLDRANVIEFRISSKELGDYFDANNNQLNMKMLCEEDTDVGKGAKYGESLVTIAKSKEATKDATVLNDELKKFFEKLQEIGAEFGYRSASEIQILFKKLDDIDISYSSRSNEKIDIAIMQKLLPKLHGSRSKLVDVLFVLASFCYDKDEFGVDELKKIFEKPDKFATKIKYPISLEKINRMYRNVIDNGFTSYAEA